MNQKYLDSVYNSLRKHYGNDVELYHSTRKDKKFMVQDPNGKWVHFGAKGYEDWHQHRDKQRLKQFQQRNHRWEHAPRWTPAHLAYHVLWN